MIDRKLFWSCVLLFTVVVGSVDTYKILGVIPTAAKSHFMVNHALLRALANKGHEVTVISPISPIDKIENYRVVEVPSIANSTQGSFEQNMLKMHDMNAFEHFKFIYDNGVQLSDDLLGEPSVQELMASGETFDLVICEIFLSESLLGLAEHFNATIIGLSSFGASKWSNDMVGTPSPLSYVPNPFLPFTHRMTLLQRIFNLAVATFDEIYSNYFYMPRQNEVFNRYFPNSKLGLEKTRKNAALVLLNAHVSQGFPRPYMPNMIEVGGMHINRKRKPLPDDMQKFIDEAKHGVIYFSLGSNLKSTMLPIQKREAFLETFKSLKQRVLWKFEGPTLPGKSDNVFISNWFPQDDVLAQPNVKLFITHGGLLSTTESVYHGKPFIGIPIFGDQFLNMARAESDGYGIWVNFNKLTKESLLDAINKMLTNPEYTDKLKTVSERYRDQPLEPLDLAIYWVEYIVRHKGAPHLRSACLDLNFIQYHNLDAIVILFGGIFSLLGLILVAVYKLVLRLSSQTKKVKRN